MGERVRCDEQQILDLVKGGATNADLVVAVGVCDRTLNRWRAARPALNDAINAERERQRTAALTGHGTQACYRRGCRCDACRAANAQMRREQLRRVADRPVPPTVTHGRAYVYHYYRCRCDACRAAKRPEWRRESQQRASRRSVA